MTGRCKEKKYFWLRFVGYLEEQAVVTYSHILEELDSGNLPMWKILPAPPIAVDYWQLPKDALVMTYLDVQF
jgi:hypothetical protein